MYNWSTHCSEHLSLTLIKTTSLVNIKEKSSPVFRECKKSKMAQKGCESCSKWQEHYHREHMDVRKISFFKLMTGDFEQCISIPEKFVNNFSGQITRGFNLKAPSGKEWRVGVSKIANELFFMSGWEDFAKAHELQESDILLFKHSGKYAFDVLIFDASGCEKVSCFFTDKKDPCVRNNSGNIMGQQAEEHCLLSDSDDATMPTQLVGSPHKASDSKITKPTKEPESPGSSNYRVKREAIDEEESDDEDVGSNYCYSRFASYLTGEEREEIFGLASIQSGNPVFVAVLQKSHVCHKNILIIPSKFAAKHLERKSHDILLLRPKRKEKCYVRYYHGSVTRGFNCRCWAKFIRDNRLREGHVCIFELMKGAKKATMTVHVFRKSDGQFVLMG